MILYYILRPIIWVLEHILFRIEVTGREHLAPYQKKDSPGYVVACNHLCDLDPVFIIEAIWPRRQMRILAKQELFKSPLVGWFLGCMGAVAVDRGKGDLSTVNRVTQACRDGRGLLVFPEGTRSKTGKLGLLKSGAFVVASQAGVDMVPCRIIYDTPSGHIKLFCRMRICFAAPIPASELTIEDPKRSVASLRRMKNRLKAELETLYDAHHFDRPALPEQAGQPEPEQAVRPIQHQETQPVQQPAQPVTQQVAQQAAQPAPTLQKEA